MLIPFLDIKKVYLQILAQFFAYSLFQILKKVYLQILKWPFHPNNNFKGNNPHKDHYTSNSHKNNYTNR